MKNSDLSAGKRPDGLPVGKPFQPGQSGNPKGRPVGSVSVKAELQKLMNIIIKGEHNFLTDENEDMPAARKVALNLASKAIADGDLLAIIRIVEHLDGKPAQSVNVGGQEDNPVQHTFTLKIDNQ